MPISIARHRKSPVDQVCRHFQKMCVVKRPDVASEAAGVLPLHQAANGVIASSRKAWPALHAIAARGPNCCASRSPEVTEHIKSLRCQRMPGKEIAPTVGVLPRGQPHVQASGLSKLSALEAADMSASRGAASGRPWGHADLGTIMVREQFA
jgi:hypothetical protein